ncbi:MAG: exonuclease SbcCD subunit D C-terminal domain-containing protein [Candidatus Cloacimonetes bacterium]|nr:exonuclease SbcCD subunit D C-terminal domain-containing protein [Candidatus Cloacimonadota bacterium]
MKLLHTSDWHLGQRFHHLTRHREHFDFLEYLVQFIKEHSVDILIIAGDVFDTANPSREAEKLYYDFLKNIVSLGFCKIIIIGGNHDSSSHLNGPKVLLESLNIHIYGHLSDNLQDMVVDCSLADQRLHIACIPYLRDTDIRRQDIEDSIADVELKIRQGITKIYSDMSKIMPKDSINIATGHLFAIGSRLSDSERSIHVGSLGAVAQDGLQHNFDYIALGHLHKCQSLNKDNTIRYCGSPIPLSFGEAKQVKEITLLDIENDKIEMSTHELPKFRPIFQISGDFEQVQKEIHDLASQVFSNTPWLEIKLTQKSLAKQSYDSLFQVCEEYQIELVKVILDQSRDLIDGYLFSETDISELSPSDIFAQRLEHYDGDSSKQDLNQCFSQLLDSYYESKSS